MSGNIHEEGNHGNGFDKSVSKKRHIDEVEGDVIFQDTFKKVLQNADSLVSDSNKVTWLRLESEPDSFGSKEYVFNPEFTNQIYRQEEEIYGYKDLEVNIHLLSGSLYPHLNVKYTDKAPDADNLEECLMEAFTDGFLSKTEFVKKLAEEANFKPLGEKIYEYELFDSPDHTFEIYHCKFSTPGFIEYNRRLQVFVKFFIDGASFIEETDFWDYYILYRKNQKGVYTVCGYCTTYSFYLNAERKRIRVSQFIILPPFQRKSHGSSLLKVAYTQAIKDKQCFEITVEDSSMDFQHLRDLNDIKWCLGKGFFEWALKYHKKKPTLDEYKTLVLTPKEIKSIQTEIKLTKNQIKRVYEILRLAIGDMENSEMFLEFKNKVKTRLYFANRVEFLPFLKKKYPYIWFDSKKFEPFLLLILLKAEMMTIPIEKFREGNLKPEEVDERLQEYWQELYDQYNAIMKKVDLILDNMSEAMA